MIRLVNLLSGLFVITFIHLVPLVISWVMYQVESKIQFCPSNIMIFYLPLNIWTIVFHSPITHVSPNVDEGISDWHEDEDHCHFLNV